MLEEHPVAHSNWHDGSFTCRQCREVHRHEGFDEEVVVCTTCGTKMIVRKHPHPCFEILAGMGHEPIVVEMKMLLRGAPSQEAPAGGPDV